ncbi:D-alanine--D-alanine ligase [bacterium]|nr:D-alanine--D-alanine ligase [bacterium]
MKIGITYNLGSDYEFRDDDPPDAAAEFDTPATIEGLTNAIEAFGHDPIPIGDGKHLFQWLSNNKADLIFNIAEGYNGRAREAQIPALLDMMQVPYVGSDAVTLGVALDKVMTKQIMKAERIPTAPFLKVSRPEDLNGVPLRFPLFAKPVHEGTGKGIDATSRIMNYPKLKSKVKYLIKTYKEPVLIEEYLEGDEYTVGIVGTPPKVIGTMQIVFDTSKSEDFYSYHVKEDYESLVHYICPPKMDPDKLQQIEDMALHSYRVLDCKDFGRVDIRCDAEGNPHFLEINPLAGLNPQHSDLSIIARHNGIHYEDLIGRILQSAITRHKLA